MRLSMRWSSSNEMSEVGGVSRATRALWAALIITGAIAGLGSETPAQEPPRCNGALMGQFLGPYDFRSQINPGEVLPILNPPPRYREIAHAVLLPGTNELLLWNARKCIDIDPTPCPASPPPPIPSYGTFIWNLNAPTGVSTLVVPGSAGESDLFCGGQVISQEGHVVTFGGTDVLTGCTPVVPPPPPPDSPCHFTTGHKKVWIFLSPGSVRLWVANAPPAPGNPDMQRERWYASTILLSDGRILVAGNVGAPLGAQPKPTSRTREHGTMVTGPVVDDDDYFKWDDQSATKNFFNYQYQSSPLCAKSTSSFVEILTYGHLHVLRDGKVISLLSSITTSPSIFATAYLDFNACPGDTETERWRVSAQTQPLPKPSGAPSIHIVDARPAIPTEVIYSIGGGTEENGCTNATNQVSVMNNPDVGAAWVAGPPLAYVRNSSNAVIGLDGAIYVFGGVDLSCSPVFDVERLRPVEVFHSGTGSWQLMCQEQLQRSYHSWALLLPDGSIASGGGTNPSEAPNDCNMSLEVFKPPYLFRGPQPQILNWPDDPPTKISGGDTVIFNALLPGFDQTGEFRVALLPPGAVTHAFNTNQRYVMMNATIISQNPDGSATISAAIPNNFAAPPGWYMLSVVNVWGVPSLGHWLRIVLPTGP